MKWEAVFRDFRSMKQQIRKQFKEKEEQIKSLEEKRAEQIKTDRENLELRKKLQEIQNENEELKGFK